MIDTYHGLKLDDFQREAIYHLDQGMSVFVSAPTGTGKTLIADYIIEKDFAAGSRVIYTAPIKALSNQKYKQFKALVGEANVGLVTGDVVTNESAPIVLMTTEIFRNMLLESNDSMEDVAHVIFDEIHYIADEERGFVWEESLIFMPEHMQFLGLSATVPNADQLAQWMGTLRAEPIKVVKAFDRVVPLEHRFYSPETGICSRKTVVRYYKPPPTWVSYPTKSDSSNAEPEYKTRPISACSRSWVQTTCRCCFLFSVAGERSSWPRSYLRYRTILLPGKRRK